MNAEERAILDRVNADRWALLYRCRWSASDAALVVPQLTGLLSSNDPRVVLNAMGALFRIGLPAAAAAAPVARLTTSAVPLTKQMAVLTLGQIGHKCPSIAVKPLAAVLTDRKCCRDAMRALAYIGPDAAVALDRVVHLFESPDAKTRKAAVVTAASIAGGNPSVLALLRRATKDRSQIVRKAAETLLSKRP